MCVKGMLRLGGNTSSCSKTGISKGGREPFWRCSGRALDSWLPHVVDRPENVSETATQVKRTAHKPINQQTNKRVLTSKLASQSGSIRATATDLKIPQKMAWWPQTRLKSFFWVLYNQEPQKVTNSLLISISKNVIRGCYHDASSLNNDWDNLSLEAALDEVMPWETRILTKQAKLGTSGLGKYACQGHAATVLQHELMFKYWRFNRRQRTILKM